MVSPIKRTAIAAAAACVCAALPSVSAELDVSDQKTGTIADVNHIVLFMQENRAFDHYFGSMPGVRGFKDPNVLIGDNGLPIWYQPTGRDDVEYLLPFYLGENATYKAGIQCAYGGSNDWTPNHAAWNFGAINGWVTNNSEYTVAYYRRDDVPTHFAVADGWTLGDMYSEFIIGPTAPNRAAWISGTLNIGNVLGDSKEMGGPFIENWVTHGTCEEKDNITFNCFPLNWTTIPELLETQNISWFTYRDADSTNDDPMYYFENYLNSSPDEPLARKGYAYDGFPAFLNQTANGTLPEVSWIIGSFPLSEHPPNTPTSGAWIIEKTIEAITQSQYANDTVILISYDETGGWGDHVPPFVSPEGTEAEWSVDYEDSSEYVPSGPGFRVPFFAISPWTRGGYVFTEPSDHTSQLLFLEKWAAAKGKNVFLENISAWRRSHMSDLTNMFDFENPDYSQPTLTNVSWPAYSDGAYVATDNCQNDNEGLIFPPVPYGNQTIEDSLWTEDGFKPVRGSLTEGRYLTFVSQVDNQYYGLARYHTSTNLHSLVIDDDFKDKKHRFYLLQQGDAFSKRFKLRSAIGGYITAKGLFNPDHDQAAIFTIEFTASKGYSLYLPSKGYLALSADALTWFWSDDVYYYSVMSVTYNN
ncbi:phosphoesterase family-domain-containing protein [Lipomyces oligophaga]|uniref:phosphoesterase family-domain-containing protein n=1 Tax=Lipomyces oligophaga TaxID=45792 RepID=UPI0034CE5378